MYYSLKIQKILLTGNEDEFNSFSQKIKVKEIEINEDQEIDHEEEEEESLTLSGASTFNQQLVLFVIFFQHNLIMI